MQRMRHRLARHAEPVGEFVLPDALPRQKRAIDDGVEDPRIDLVGQIGEWV
jgi:hypothetical protein